MVAQQQGFGHPECYARALGECCSEMTEEHPISGSVLGQVDGRAGVVSRSVLVTGLAFQERGALKKIGISRLVGKVLCKTHNGLLSPFDDAGKAMFTGMDALNDAAGNPALSERVSHVDGDALERWILKSLCGGFYSGAFLASSTEKMKGICPPPEWLQILFKGAEFPDGQGLYYMPGKPKDLITADQDVLRVEPLDVQWAFFRKGWFADKNLTETYNEQTSNHCDNHGSAKELVGPPLAISADHNLTRCGCCTRIDGKKVGSVRLARGLQTPS